ncbi:MAG: VanZ family protein [Clostridia bacterium]|nr:VanZ family protein [Clostridia bacterium]
MKKKIFAAFSWAAVAVCMGIIFFLSAQNGTESGDTSHWLLELLSLPVSEAFLRNAAHFLEFTGLAVLLFNAFYQTCGKEKPFLSFAIASAYAATDEFHQLFVEGRACTFSDWLTDSCGALTGVIAACLLIKIFSCIKRGKTN